MKVAFVYSGQGSQYVGMGQELYDAYPVYRQVFQEASDVLGFEMAELCFNEGTELNATEYTQPAILTMSMAISAVLKEEIGVTPAMVAGLSLGEYSALVESGALAFQEAVALVKQRGKFMTEAVPKGVGAMSAVMGLSRQEVEEACQKASSKGVVIAANYNMPTQIAIAGEVEAVAYAEEILTEIGARRVIRLNVSGPFHTTLLEPASIKLAEVLGQVTVNEMKIPVVTNVNGSLIPSKEAIIPTLVKQVMSPVYWQDCVETLIAEGVDTFIEVGPGKALTGFIKKIDKTVTVQNVENLKTLAKVKQLLKDAE